MRLSFPLLLLLARPVQATPAPGAYDEVVERIHAMYLHPEEVDDEEMLAAAVRRLEDALHWLVAEVGDGQVVLRHGDGSAIGSVSLAQAGSLPDALRQVEALVVGSGQPLLGVDVRLELLRGTTDALDRFSRVLADDAKTRFDIRLSGTAVGIGVELAWEDAGLTVASVAPGGPAALAGIREGDVVERIDGRSVVSMPVREAQRRLRGPLGTEVRVVVRRGEQPARELSLARARVIVNNVEHRILPGSVGYVRIEHVSQKTVHNLLAALDDLRVDGALDRGLVLDLRGNTGGSLKESARVADLFVEGGLLVRTAGPDGGRVPDLVHRMDGAPGGAAVDLPLVTVVDDRTASGSEILAGALVELGRTVLVGTRTYGKGSVQQLYDIDDHAELKLTIAEYLLEGGRRIDHLGLVPDAVIGRVEFDGYGVRFRDFDEGRQRTPWDAIVPWVVQDEGGLGQIDDLPLEIARRTALAMSAPTREAGLDALDAVVRDVRVEEEGRLLTLLEQRGVDWSPAREEGTFLDAAVDVFAEPWEGRADVMRVRARVLNRSDEPLHRALVQLECWSNPAWDDVVIPVGRIAPGEEATGEVAVPLEPGVGPREDVVDLRLRAHRRAPYAAGQTVLFSASRPAPDVRVAARLRRTDEGDRAELTVINDAPYPLYDVEVQFGWPGDLDVEIVDQAVRIPVIPAGDRYRADLEMVVGPGAPPVLPLKVRVEAAQHGTLARWPLALPADGRTVTLSAPRVALAEPELSLPEGPAAIPLVVQDDGRVDYVVVYAHGRKVAWEAGGRGRVRLAPEIDLLPGVNHLFVEAGDDDGLRTVRTFAIRGEPPAAVDASP